MNKIILTGNLCKAIDLRHTGTGKAVTSNTIAVSRDMKDQDGNYISDFIDIVVWDKAAEYLNNYASKGDRAEVVGRLQQRTYQDGNGMNRTVYEVQVESIKTFQKAPKTENDNPFEKPRQQVVQDDDCPF